MSDLVPDEAVARAVATWYGVEPDEGLDPADQKACADGMRDVLEAAAPLIVAAAYEQLAESINYPRFRENTKTGLVTSVDLIREDLLERASVLREAGS